MLAGLEFIKMIASQASVIPASDLVLVNVIRMSTGLLIVPPDTLEDAVIIENTPILSPQRRTVLGFQAQNYEI